MRERPRGQAVQAAIDCRVATGDNTAQATIAPIFDKAKIEAGFDITRQFINEAGTFVNNRAKEADAAKKAANDPSLTPDQRAAAQQQADQLNAEWGPGGSYRQVMTALTVAAGGNVTGGMGQFAQGAAVAYLQELGANQVKQIADSLDSETARAALHSIVGCAGAAGSGASCGAGAMGAAASSVIGSLLGPTTNMSAADREARENLVTSLVAGIAAGGGVNAATATGSAQIEAENNQLASVAPPPSWLPGLIKLPGFKGETAGKGDGVIADPATELDPSAKAGPLVTPDPGPGKMEALITALTPDWLKDVVNGPTTMAGYKPNASAVGNMKEFLNSPGFGSDLSDASRKTSRQVDGQSVYKATDDVGSIAKGDLFYLDGQHMDHLEVFDSRGNFKAVVNLDGTENANKTDAGSGRKINVK
ncbi:hypothetical protein WCQ02_19235 [Paraburkholderia tropica]|uniref:hypothetical protein n=1 Tax=Paraburkholderia tropica TaxID=92647 RepID=UPI00301999DB